MKTQNGKLTIEKRNVTLTSATDTKEFDGNALTNDKVTVSGDGFADGEGATYNVTGSQKIAGSSPNYFTYTLKSGTKAENYTITKNEGTLTVTNRNAKYEITVVAKSKTEKYDGKGKTVEGLVTTTFVVNGNTYTVEGLSANAAGTDAGEYAANVTGTAVVKDADGHDVTAQFAVKTQNGKLTIDPKKVTLTSANATKKYDKTALTKNEVTSDGFVGDDGAEYTVTGTQTLVGASENTFTYSLKEGTKAENYAITTIFGILTVTDGTTTDPVDPNKVVTKTHNNKTYELGDTVNFEIKVTNIYDAPKTITITEKAGVTITGQSVFENVAAGATVTTYAQYTITEADILAGRFRNDVTATFKDGKSFDNKDDVVPDNKNGHLTVSKETTNTPKNGKAYALGEEITYKVTVTNDGNLTISNIKVTDALTGNVGNDAWTVASLAPGKRESFTAKYTVTEADILEGKVVNEATATGTGSDGEDAEVTPGKKEDPTDAKNGHLTVTKETTSTPKNGNTYALDEKITYEVTVTNDGNLTITDIKVTDALTGNVGNDAWTVASLAPGKSQTFEAEYTVTEADVLAGEVVNVATATGTSPDPEKTTPDVTPGDTKDPTVTPAPSLFISKEAAKDTPAQVGLGDTISYTITVVNNGNVTIKEVTVKDSLTGDEKTYDALKPGDKKELTVTYKVTEADILAGKVINTATVTGKDPSGNPIDNKDDETVTTEAKDGKLVITKTTTSTPKENGKYALGETIKYQIVAKNAGNLTITNIKVTDELTGDAWTIKSLAPGKSETFTAQYTVTEKDILAGKVVNVATATGTSPDPENPEVPVTPGEKEDPTDTVKATYTVDKSIVNQKDEYEIGDTIEYQIVVENTGNVTIKDINVTDQLTDASGKVTFTDVDGAKLNDENTVTINKLEPKSKVTLKCEYEVTREDAGKSIVNTAIAKSDTEIPDPENPNKPIKPADPEDSTDPVPVEKLYNLIIHYVYADGTTAAADYTGTYLAGEPYGPVYSPEIDGYTPNYAFVRSGSQGMPAQDVELTVVYTANPAQTPDLTPNPTNAGDDNPGLVQTQTTAAQATIQPQANNIPVGAAIEPNVDGGIDVVPVVDEQVPLADMDLENHDCCILHFLLMLLALLVLALYTRSMKKRQERINELREELETEMLKRELGLVDEKENAEM